VDAAAGETPSEAPGRIGSLISAILPAAQEATRDEQAALARPTAQKGGAAGDRLERAVHANVEMVVQALRAGEPVLGPAVQEGRLRIVGGYYHLANGTVDMTVP
jgi:carbonic anhydrase